MARYIVGPAQPVYVVDPDADVMRTVGPAEPVYCPFPGNTASGAIVVAKSGGDYTTIEAALAAAVARDTILVYPGIYQENNPLLAVANVTLKAVGELVTTRIEALNVNQDLFTSANAFILDGFSLANVSGTGWIMNVTEAHSVRVLNGAFLNCSNGIRTNNTQAFVTVSDVLLFALPGATTCSYCNSAGTLTVRSGGVGPGSTITNVFNVDGANATLILRDFVSFAPGVTTMLQADNNARIGAVGCSFAAMVDGVVAQGGATVDLKACSIVFAQQDGVRINNVGSGTSVFGYALLVAESTRFDFNVLSATALVSGMGGASFDKINFTVGATVSIGLVDLKEGDEGFNVLGELHVGMPEAPTETALGGGDSYTRGMIVYTYNPAGAVWTDVSTAAQSASGSTFTFPALLQDNAIYVASGLYNGVDFLQHFGIKVAITTAIVLGVGEIVVEYWNGGAWAEIEHMSALANSPYTQYAKDIFERTGNEQIRYPQAFLASWVKNDPMTLGTTYYWIRFRVATAVTTVPIFQQYKLHTNRFEVNADGTSEYFGAARYPKDLIVHLAISDPVVGSAPANASVAFSANISLTLTRNQLNDNQVHSFGEQITIPTGIDTSIPITVEVVWYPNTNNAGNVQLEIYDAQLEVGDLFDGTAAEVTEAKLQAVPANDQFVSRLQSWDVDISSLEPGDLLVFKIERDATGGSPDTLAGNIIVASLRAFGFFWRP